MTSPGGFAVLDTAAITAKAAAGDNDGMRDFADAIAAGDSTAETIEALAGTLGIYLHRLATVEGCSVDALVAEIATEAAGAVEGDFGS